MFVFLPLYVLELHILNENDFPPVLSGCTVNVLPHFNLCFNSRFHWLINNAKCSLVPIHPLPLYGAGFSHHQLVNGSYCIFPDCICLRWCKHLHRSPPVCPRLWQNLPFSPEKLAAIVKPLTRNSPSFRPREELQVPLHPYLPWSNDLWFNLERRLPFSDYSIWLCLHQSGALN